MAWSKEETLKLIDIWARADIQVQLEGCHRNCDVYQKIAKELREEGGCTNRTYEQCWEKVKKLKGDYRKIKDKQHKTGEERNDWEYFEAMDSVLCHKPATHNTPFTLQRIIIIIIIINYIIFCVVLLCYVDNWGEPERAPH